MYLCVMIDIINLFNKIQFKKNYIYIYILLCNKFELIFP